MLENKNVDVSEVEAAETAPLVEIDTREQTSVNPEIAKTVDEHHQAITELVHATIDKVALLHTQVQKALLHNLAPQDPGEAATKIAEIITSLEQIDFDQPFTEQDYVDAQTELNTAKSLQEAARQTVIQSQVRQNDFKRQVEETELELVQFQHTHGDVAAAYLTAHEQHHPLKRGIRSLLKRRTLQGMKEKQSTAQELQQKLAELMVQQQDATALLIDQSETLTNINNTMRDYWKAWQKAPKHIFSRILTTPAKTELDQHIEALATPLASDMIDHYCKNHIEPVLNQELYREETRNLSSAEWQGLQIEEISKRRLMDYTTRDNSISTTLSLQGATLLNLPVTSDSARSVQTRYDPYTRNYSFCQNGQPIVSFNEDHVTEMDFYLYTFEPGKKIGRDNQFEVLEWDLANRLLRVKDQAGDEHRFEGTESIIRFAAQSYPIVTEPSSWNELQTPAITLHTLDPHSAAYETGMVEGQHWNVRRQEDGGVTLSRTLGSLSPENHGQALITLKEMLHHPADEQWHLSYEIRPLLQSALEEHDDDFHNIDVSQFAQNDFKTFVETTVRLSLQQSLSPVEAEAPDHLGLIDSNLLEPQKLCSILSDYKALHDAIEHPIMTHNLRQERHAVITTLMTYARTQFAKSDWAWGTELMLDFGENEDFYTVLLETLRSDHSLQAMLDAARENPSQFEHKLKQCEHFLPGVSAVSRVFEQADNDDSHNGQPKPDTRDLRERIRGTMAPQLRHAITNPGTLPELKMRYFNMLRIGPNSSLDPILLLEDDGTLDPQFSEHLMLFMRTFPGIEDVITPSDINQSSVDQFAKGFERLSHSVTDSGSHLDLIVRSNAIMGFLARHPETIEDVLRLPEEVPEFIEMISETREFASNRDQLLRYLFADGTLFERARALVTIFSGTTDLSAKLTSFIEARLLDSLDKSDSKYPCVKKDDDPTAVEAFGNLSLEAKKTVLFDHIKRSIQQSRSIEAKQQASEENRSRASRFRFTHGMYVHGLRADIVSDVLKNGNLCGEALGPDCSTDSYPFHVDYSYITRDMDLSTTHLEDTVSELPTNSFGRTVVDGKDHQVILITDRSRSQWEQGITYFADNRVESNHALILGACPATEIHAFVLRDPEGSLVKCIDACIEEEHYVPMYALTTSDRYQEGELVFSHEEYQRLLETRKPYHNTSLFIQETAYLEPYDFAQKSGAHRFTLKDHLLLATYTANETALEYDLSDHERSIVCVAARLHDIGKDQSGEQVIDNPVIASGFLSQIRGLSADDKELILNLIRYDELLGDILQGHKKPELFGELFPNPRHQRMLLSLYKADVKSIDGDEDEGSVYKQWQVDQKLQTFGLERSL